MYKPHAAVWLLSFELFDQSTKKTSLLKVQNAFEVIQMKHVTPDTLESLCRLLKSIKILPPFPTDLVRPSFWVQSTCFYPKVSGLSLSVCRVSVISATKARQCFLFHLIEKFTFVNVLKKQKTFAQSHKIWQEKERHWPRWTRCYRWHRVSRMNIQTDRFDLSETTSSV